MDINKALALLREGKLRDCSLDDLRTMSAGSVVFIQNRIPDAVHLKTALDDEIRRKEAQEAADKLLHQTNRLVQYSEKLTQQTDTLIQHSEKLTQQTDRLVEETVKLTDFTRGVFWFTIILGVFAIVQIIIMLFEYCSKKPLAH